MWCEEVWAKGARGLPGTGSAVSGFQSVSGGTSAANIVFSAVGNGAASRAGTVVAFLWIAFVSVRLLQKGGRPAASSTQARPGA